MDAIESVILLDVPDGHGQLEEATLAGMGHKVIVCHGPQSGALCPILAKGGACSKVEGAHGIVFELDLDRPQHRAILRRYQEVVDPGIPIRVLVAAEQAERYRDLLGGVDVWTYAPSVGELDAFSARVEGYERVSRVG